MTIPPSAPERVATGRLRLALFGSPAFAVPVLDALAGHHEVAVVVTQPDRPAGRGMRLRAPAAAVRARELGLPLAQPDRLRRNDAFRERLRSLDLDVAVTAAYGKILPSDLLEVPRHGFLNVHASLLPKYRGAAPVQWAILRGERETGITIMQTEAGLDTGPVRHVRVTPIGPDETAPELLERLARLGAEAALEALDLLARGELPSHPQDDACATHAPMLTAEDGRADFAATATELYDRFRATAGWPGCHVHVGEERLKLTALRPAPDAPEPTDAGAPATAEPGTILAVGPEGVTVACGRGRVLLERVKPAGKREMGARDWANGRRVGRGDRLG